MSESSRPPLSTSVRALPDGLATTFGQHLTYQQEMQGQAEIVVEDLRVLDRIFYQFRRLFRNGTTVLPSKPLAGTGTDVAPR